MSAATMNQLPPSYPGAFPAPGSGEFNRLSGYSDGLDGLDLLPEYTPGRNSSSFRAVAARQPTPKEFYYEVKKKGKAFAVLTIIAEGSYSKHMPTFLEGTPIKGRVRLSLDKPDAIQSVIVSVQGQVITGANQGEQLTFVDIQRTVWSQSDGEPQNTSSDSGDSSPLPPTTATNITGNGNAPPSPKFTGKLQGDYTWQFSIDLPKQVVVPFGNRNEPQIFRLPATFNERHTRASVCYNVTLRLNRGKLRTDHRIPAQIGFIPIGRPAPFSPLRKLAYQEGTPLLGPVIDPEGWHASEPEQIQISVFGNRTVQIRCTLYLAKPLTYTRGSLIPFCLRLDGHDEQALDLLSSPKAIVLRLRRRIKAHWNPEKTFESMAWRDAIDHSQLAVWWPSRETPEMRGVRYVNGELHLKVDANPTSAMAHFRIEYSAVLFPFDSPGIVLDKTEQIIEQPVEVVTAYAPGPRPRMSAPPGYEDTAVVPQINAAMTFAHPGGFV
ncbi:hypothetical protein CPC08DRAFT_686837 [Agrocybe pediades]|nr:hypothetical protein CPC08DRAFT_686837 [Agrocybe pediades]